jgi:hypothetical protein
MHCANLQKNVMWNQLNLITNDITIDVQPQPKAGLICRSAKYHHAEGHAAICLIAHALPKPSLH